MGICENRDKTLNWSDARMNIQPELAKKLYDQNCERHRIQQRCSCEHKTCIVYRKFPAFKQIKASWEFVEKYTIVELIVNDMHFHGLTARSDKESVDNASVGITIAYNRAFKAMIGV